MKKTCEILKDRHAGTQSIARAPRIMPSAVISVPKKAAAILHIHELLILNK